MTRRELRERRERQRRRQRRVRMIRLGLFCGAVLLVLLLLFFGIRAIVRRGKKTDPAAETEVTVQTPAEQTAVASPNTATKRVRTEGDGKPGWNTDQKGWWYQDEAGSMYAGGWQTIDGVRYYFLPDGYLATGWQTVDGEEMFFRESGIRDDAKAIRYVALTYDEGPSDNTEDVLNVLAKYDAKATFFVCGGQVAAYADTVTDAIEDGMEIASYTYDNGTLLGLDPLEVLGAVTITDATIESAVGVTPALLRPPAGEYDDVTTANATKPIILWSLTSSQIVKEREDRTYDLSIDKVKDGDIIRLFDIYDDAEAVTKVLAEALYREGYKMVTVSELAQVRGVTLIDGEIYESFPAG